MSYLKHKPGSIEEMMANQAKKLNDSAYQDMFKKELEKAGKGIGAMTPAEKKAFFNKIDDKYKAKNEAVDNPYAVGMAAAMKKTGDKPPLKKSTITKAHDIAKSIEKDQKEELNKDDENVVKKVKDMLTKASQAHADQAKELDKAMKSEDSQELQKDKTDNYKEKNKEAIKEVKYPHKMYSKDGKEVEAKTPEDHKKYSDMGYTHTKETHSFVTNKQNQKQKDAKGEKEIVTTNEADNYPTKDMNDKKHAAYNDPKKGEKKIVDPKPKLNFKEAYKKVKEAMNTVGDATADKANQIVGQDDKKNDPDIKKPKVKTDTGSKATPVDTSPDVEYKN